VAAGALEELAKLLKPTEIQTLAAWPLWCLPHQHPPATANPNDLWRIWLLLGGRGAGKTRAGSEFVRGMALGELPFAQKPVGRIALVGETYADVRDVMIEGVSGILASHHDSERPVWTSSRRRLEWPNGAIAMAFSAEDPDALRGHQFEAAWCDELAKWSNPDATWDMLQFGLRLGKHPRQMVTTTPRPLPLLKRLMADPESVISRARTVDNAANLSPAFVASITACYAGSRLGRQELDGEIIEDRADALWTRVMIEASRTHGAPALERIVVAVDPPATSTQRADACGLVVAGRDEMGVIYVLAEESVQGLRPAEWAAKAVALFHRYEADALVVEVNQGGDMVGSVICEVDPSVPVTSVRATRGKYLRAEPVAALYEQGRVHHVGAFPALEDEMCDFGPGGLTSGRSPDRLDALVWAITDLALSRKGRPRVRSL
jgi:phage terminase large subunit-like protein